MTPSTDFRNHSKIASGFLYLYPAFTLYTVKNSQALKKGLKKRQPKPFYTVSAAAAVLLTLPAPSYLPMIRTPRVSGSALCTIYYFTIRILLPGAGSFLSDIPFNSRRRCTGRQYCLPTFQSVSPCSNKRIAIPGRLPSFS